MSAMSGETNRLLALAKELSANPDPREVDVVAATGEQVTIGLLAIALREIGAEGAQLHRRAGAHPHRQRAHEGADHRDRRAAHPAGPRRGHDRRRRGISGRGQAGQRHHARARRLRHVGRSAGRRAQGRRVPDLHRRRRRLHDRSAHRPGGAAPRRITFEEMLELASQGSKVLQIRSVEFAGKYMVRAAGAVVVRGRRCDVERNADHFRGRRRHGTGDHLRDRVQSRRGEDVCDGRRGPAGHRLRDPRSDRRREHRRRHDRAEHRRVGAHRLLVHRQPQRVSEGAGRS